MSVQDVSLSKTYRKSKIEIYALNKKVRFRSKKRLAVTTFRSFHSSGPELQTWKIV